VESLWERIREGLKEGVLTAAEKTEELAKVGKGKIDVVTIRRKIGKTFAELGGKVYHMVTEEKTTAIADRKEVKQLIDQVKGLEKQLKAKEEEIQRARGGTSS
jgi:hypothetical protein